jgi:DNA processing protein
MVGPGEQQPLPLDSQEGALTNTRPDDDELSFFALSGIGGVGEATMRQIISAIPELHEIWELPEGELASRLAKGRVRSYPELVRQIGRNAPSLIQRGEQQRSVLKAQNIQLVLPQSSRYPATLTEIADKPRWLFVQGDVEALSRRNLVAVVGSRTVSRESTQLARTLTQHLARRGVGIVSGLAEGIDEVAHETALDYGVNTVAVLGHGINVIFPTKTAHLRQAIIDQGGAIVSEYLPSDSYAQARFVQRNRIQAALSQAVCPVAANENSGTTHTFRFAQKYKKIVFGVRQGDAPKERGIHKLLATNGFPIFDLDKADDLSALDQLLAEVLAHSDPNSSDAAFSRLLSEFKRVARTYPVSDEQMQRLVEQLRQVRQEYSGGR